MTHRDVLRHFKNLFPEYVYEIDIWFPNGKNSIRIRLKHKEEFVFSIDDPKKWRFETVENFIANMRGAR